MAYSNGIITTIMWFHVASNWSLHNGKSNYCVHGFFIHIVISTSVKQRVRALNIIMASKL